MTTFIQAQGQKNHSHGWLSLIGLLLLILVQACAPRQPLELVSREALPSFSDDLDRASLISATVRQLHYLDTLPGDKIHQIGNDQYSTAWLQQSLESFLDILKQNPDSITLGRILQENYNIYQVRSNQSDRPLLVTGYYEPLFEGSLIKSPPFVYPLYGMPDSLVIRKNQQTGRKESGRMGPEGQLLPFWSRAEIETADLLSGHELVYLKDPIEAFTLHIQGSGKIHLPDGSIRSMGFAAANGLPYKSIGRFLVNEGHLTLEQATMEGISAYLRAHPQEQQKIFHHNPRFIFFAWRGNSEPIGSLGEDLTPGRSIAVDPAVLPVAAPAWLVSRQPVFATDGSLSGWRPLQRCVLPQDTGNAIKGTGRIDLFWGRSALAGKSAGLMREEGQLFFLVKNNFELPDQIDDQK